MKNTLYLIALCAATLIGCKKSSPIMFGLDPLHTSTIENTLPEQFTLSEVWKFKTGATVSGSAVIADETLFFGSEDSCLYALTKNGDLKWRFKTNGKICSTPAVYNNVVYINNYGATFYAIDAQKGNLLWRFKTEGETVRMGKGLNWSTPKDSVVPDVWDFYTSSPTIYNETLYFGSGNRMYALDIQSHSLKWSFSAPNVVHSTPAVAFNRVFFGCWNGAFYAVNAQNGKIDWSLQTDIDTINHGMEGIQASPSLIDSFVVIGARDAHVYCCNATNGNLVWKQKFAQTWMPSSFAYDGKSIFTGSSDIAQLLKLDKSSGKTLTSTNTGSYTFSSPTVVGNAVFIGSTNGTLYAVNKENGKVITTFATQGRKDNPLNVIKEDGTINNSAFTDINGTHIDFAKEYVRRLFTAGSILATPSVESDMIYFGSTDGWFYGVQIKEIGNR